MLYMITHYYALKRNEIIWHMLQCVLILKVSCYVKQARLQKHILYDFPYVISFGFYLYDVLRQRKWNDVSKGLGGGLTGSNCLMVTEMKLIMRKKKEISYEESSRWRVEKFV